MASATSPALPSAADAPSLVAHDDERAEIEPASAFDDFRGAVDEDDLFDQFLRRAAIKVHFRRFGSGFGAAAATARAALCLRLRQFLSISATIFFLVSG